MTKIKNRFLAATASFLLLTGLQAPPAAGPKAPISLWRLDCGTITVPDYNLFFSDTFAYPLGSKEFTSSCYLIRHGDRYLLWDTGVEAKYAEPGAKDARMPTLRKTIVAQLAELGLKPGQIEYVGISHYHFDHIGQAASFPAATLLIGDGDLAVLKRVPPEPGVSPELVKPWLQGGAKAEGVRGDKDIFGDGRVVMLNTPGHTPGHHSLLVRLASGNILLSGDLWHFSEQVPIDGVPPFNTDRADTLASMDRIKKMATNLNAKLIIQHEPTDIMKLPPFPQPAQ